MEKVQSRSDGDIELSKSVTLSSFELEPFSVPSDELSPFDQPLMRTGVDRPFLIQYRSSRLLCLRTCWSEVSLSLSLSSGQRLRSQAITKKKGEGDEEKGGTVRWLKKEF